MSKNECLRVYDSDEHCDDDIFITTHLEDSLLAAAKGQHETCVLELLSHGVSHRDLVAIATGKGLVNVVKQCRLNDDLLSFDRG